MNWLPDYLRDPSLSKDTSKAIVKDTLVCVVLAGCLIYARALLEYVIFTVWVRSVNKMLPSVKFAEDKVLTFLMLHEKMLK